MAYLIVFLINLLVLNFWLWLFQSMFRRKQNKRLIFVIIVAMGLLSTGAMLLYPQIAHLIDLGTFSAGSLNRQNISLLVGYVGVIGLILLLPGKKVSRTRKLLIWIVTFVALAIGIALGYIGLPAGVLLYFLCIAGAEEFLKLSIGQGFFAQFQISKKDFFLFAILSAIGFAFIENIIYALSDPRVGIVLSRSLTTVVMHIVFTGSIAYIITTRKHIGRYIVAFFIGMISHRVYNAFISYSNPRISALLVVGGYFIVSYFLYKSDRLYLKQ